MYHLTQQLHDLASPAPAGSGRGRFCFGWTPVSAAFRSKLKVKTEFKFTFLNNSKKIWLVFLPWKSPGCCLWQINMTVELYLFGSIPPFYFSTGILNHLFYSFLLKQIHIFIPYQIIIQILILTLLRICNSWWKHGGYFCARSPCWELCRRPARSWWSDSRVQRFAWIIAFRLLLLLIWLNWFILL